MANKQLTKRDLLAFDLIKLIVSNMESWDLLHTGDMSPEGDTADSEIVKRAYSITDAFLKYKDTR
jgi:hypothetical protein